MNQRKIDRVVGSLWALTREELCWLQESSGLGDGEIMAKILDVDGAIMNAAFALLGIPLDSSAQYPENDPRHFCRDLTINFWWQGSSSAEEFICEARQVIREFIDELESSE